MSVNLNSLRAALEADPRYDALVRAGSNGLIAALLNTEDPTLPKRWRSIPGTTFLEIIAPEPFTAAQEARIRTYAVAGVNLDKPAIRAWLQANMTRQKTKDDLIAAGQATGRLGDAFADEGSNVSLRDVRAAVFQVSKSLIRSTGQV